MAVPYPLHLRTVVRAGKKRSQPAAFTVAEPRRGRGYVQEIGTDVPVFWDVSFRFTSSEAVVFRLWFRNTLRKGVEEFTMPIRTEFGLIEHVCQFLPDSLMDTSEDGDTFTYQATIMARAEVVPEEFDAATDVIIALPSWPGWAEMLDETVTSAIPESGP